MIDVHDFGVTDVGAGLLEGDAKNQYLGVFYHHTLFVHALDCLVGHLVAHSIVETAGITHHTRKDTIHLSFLNEVIRVNADAVTTYETWAQIDEVPFAAGSFYDIIGIDAHCIENLGKLVHKCNVHVSLTILNYLAGLSDLDARCLMGTIYQHAIVNAIHEAGNLWCRARGDFLDFLYRMKLVTRIDTFWAVASKKIHVVLQP